MTDNIQKLYEIAGVKKKYCGWLDMGDLDTQYEYVMCDTLKEYKETAEFSRTSYSSDNENYMTPEIKYPPFTAEKQLELIKFTGNLKENNEIGIEYQKDNKLWCACLRDTYDECLNIWTHHQYFNQALANLILQLWQDLSDKQKQEIKEILE